MSAGRADDDVSLDRLNPASSGVLLDLERPGQLFEIPVFRISHPDREAIVDVAQVDGIEPVIRASEPGRYHIDQIEADPLPSGHNSRRWGVAIRRPDGSVDLEPDPCP